jgi:hypothetical protein
MGTATTRLRRSYGFHGVGIEVIACDHAVIDSMDLRLRDFRAAGKAANAVTFEFIATDEESGLGVDQELPVRGGRPVYDTPHGTLHYFPQADVIGGELAGVQLRCESARGVAVIRCSGYSGRELYLATHPLATIALMEMMERRERFSLHAACVAGVDRGGVLLSGPSGAGKSTLTLALVQAGMGFLSDDVVFLERDGSGDATTALGFADTVGLSQFAAERFPQLRDLLAAAPADGFPKRLSRIEHLFGRAGIRACEPRALVFTEVAPDRPSELAPLAPGEALIRLVPDVLLTHPAATQAHLGAIRALLAQVRCYTLRSGSDIERAAELVMKLV